ncbi:MAG: formate dehydrogenase accessory protein FdhE [Deltaproteobacteria bacterium]
MTAIDTGLQGLKREHPEWEPWLAGIQEVLAESANLEWDSAVPAPIGAQPSKAPLLAGATLVFAADPVRRFLERLMRIACHSGTAKMATLEPALRAELDVFELFKASLHRDRERIKEIAAGIGADAAAFQAVIDLLPLPFLQACYRRWASSIPESWMEGYCPACGSWPAFAEVRGIERSRYLRCGRCGAAWQAHCLFCPYCGITDHEQLVSLVPEKSGSNSVIEACKHCLGYVKSFTRLQGSPPAKVLLDDLASAHLDVAAVEEGYKRPQGAGYALAVNVIENGVTGSLLA